MMSADLLQMRSLGAEVSQEPRRRQQQKLDGLATQLQSVVQMLERHRLEEGDVALPGRRSFTSSGSRSGALTARGDSRSFDFKPFTKSGAPPPASNSSSRSQSLSARTGSQPKTISEIINAVNTCLSTVNELKSTKSGRPSRELSEPPIVPEREISYADFLRDSDISPRLSPRAAPTSGTPRNNVDIHDAIAKFYDERTRTGSGPTIVRESPMSPMPDVGLPSVPTQKSSAPPSYLSQPPATQNTETPVRESELELMNDMISTAVGSDEPLFDSEGRVIDSYPTLAPYEQPWRLKEVLLRVIRLWQKAEDEKMNAQVKYTNVRDRYWQQTQHLSTPSHSNPITPEDGVVAPPLQHYTDMGAMDHAAVPYPSATDASGKPMSPEDYYAYYTTGQGASVPADKIATATTEEPTEDPRVGS